MAAATAELIVKFVVAPNQSALNREKKKKEKKRKEKKRKTFILERWADFTNSCMQRRGPAKLQVELQVCGIMQVFSAVVARNDCDLKRKVSFVLFLIPLFSCRDSEVQHCCRSIWTESLAWRLQTWWLQALEKSKFDSPSARKTHRGWPILPRWAEVVDCTFFFLLFNNSLFWMSRFTILFFCSWFFFLFISIFSYIGTLQDDKKSRERTKGRSWKRRWRKEDEER